MGEDRRAFKMLTGKPRGKRSLVRPRRRWEDNIRTDLNLLSAYDVILRHAITVMQWPVGLNTSCCGSVLTQNL